VIVVKAAGQRGGLALAELQTPVGLEPAEEVSQRDLVSGRGGSEGTVGGGSEGWQRSCRGWW
jgi:hypothetical protein